MIKSFFRRSLPYICLLVALASIVPGLSVYFSDKPDLLGKIPFAGMILDSKGQLLKASLSEDEKYRIYIPLEKVAPFAVECLLAYEDRHFYQHPGVNPLAMLRALLQWPFSRRLSGASTISMQVARLLSGLESSSLKGKVQQIWRALILERHYSKEEILEAYFNLAPYGANIEGIEAAARIYFHKAASNLTELECIALTVIPQNPLKRHPKDLHNFNKARHRLASRLGYGELADLRLYGIGNLPFLAPHLALELEQERGQPQSRIIRTTIDRILQKDLEKIILQYAERGARLGIANASAIIVDTKDLAVVSLAGSANFFNASIEGQIDGSRARRSPGSTLKPFIYALALDQGLIHPMSILPDSPRSYGLYDPENIDHSFRGPIHAREALKASRNLPAIWLTEKLSAPGLFGFLKDAEVHFEHDALHYGLALTLGGAEISMRELASLYAMLANGGIWKPLRFTRDSPFAGGKRLLSPEAAWLTLDMLREDEFTAGSSGTPVYAKTGTSNGMRDAWTAGICGQYVIIVWVGNFNNKANPNFIGAKAAMPLFEEIAATLDYRKKLSDPLRNRPENISQANVCESTGDLYIGQCKSTSETFYIPGRSPIRDQGIIRPILIDRKTGLRACNYEEENTERVWWEFWPSDMRRIFESAGVVKKDPPAWLPECGKDKIGTSGKAPRIKSPKSHVQYQREMTTHEMKIPLIASADADVQKIYWYADKIFIGSSNPEEAIFWTPENGGEIMITAVDNLGRSKKQKCRIRTVP